MLLNPAQQENPAIRRQPAAVERDRHLLAANGWQCEGEKVIFVHDGCGVPRSLAEPALATESCDKSRLYATSVTQNRSSRCIRRARSEPPPSASPRHLRRCNAAWWRGWHDRRAPARRG